MARITTPAVVSAKRRSSRSVERQINHPSAGNSSSDVSFVSTATAKQAPLAANALSCCRGVRARMNAASTQGVANVVDRHRPMEVHGQR